MNDAQLVDWLQEQMKHSASGGIVASIARDVYQGTCIRKAVDRNRLNRLRAVLRAWGAWRRCALSGYPSMDTLGRAITYGMGGAPDFGSRSPIMTSHTSEEMRALDDLIAETRIRHRDDMDTLQDHYILVEAKRRESERADVLADLLRERQISQATWYRTLDRAHRLLLERLES